MTDQELKTLANKIDELIQLCETLDSENRHLKSEAINWHHEREQLLEKTDIARNRVEAMIIRLKALEQES